MKKVVGFVCFILALAFVTAKPVIAGRVTNQSESSCSDSWSYFLGSASCRLSWSYIYGEKVLDSSGYTSKKGIAIEAACGCMSATDYMHTWHVCVSRSIGAEVSLENEKVPGLGASISAPITFAYYDYYYGLTNTGDTLQGSVIFGD